VAHHVSARSAERRRRNDEPCATATTASGAPSRAPSNDRLDQRPHVIEHDLLRKRPSTSCGFRHRLAAPSATSSPVQPVLPSESCGPGHPRSGTATLQLVFGRFLSVARGAQQDIDVDAFLSNRISLDEVDAGFDLMHAQDGIRSVIDFA